MTTLARSRRRSSRRMRSGQPGALQLRTAIGVAVALFLRAPGWQGGAVGLVVGLLLVIRVRGTTLPRFITHRTGFVWDRRRRQRGEPESGEPFDVPMADGTQIGF